MNSADASTESRRWRALARELGGVLARSDRPVGFLLGAGASLTSGCPTTAQVSDAFHAATDVRFQGMDLMRAVQTLPESEKQAIIRPLFKGVRPGPGYLALAALARHKPVVVLNLNWDDALTQAAHRAKIPVHRFDIKSEPADWPDVEGAPSGGTLYNIHLHGILGTECRFGTLETVSFTPQEEAYLARHGLGNTLVCIGTSITGENDLPQLFKRRIQDSPDPTRPTSQHWFFVRGGNDQGADHRLRQAMTFASPMTYVTAPDIDFDEVATLIVDSALAVIEDENRL